MLKARRYRSYSSDIQKDVPPHKEEGQHVITRDHVQGKLRAIYCKENLIRKEYGFYIPRGAG